MGLLGAIIDVEDGPTAQGLAVWVAGHPDRHLLDEVVPGARTLYIAGEPSTVRRVAGQAADLTLAPADGAVDSRLVTIDIRYDGMDLVETAHRLALTPEELVDQHTGHPLEVRFFGFSPGQAFFGDLPEELRLPRRSTPRVRVPSGAVAIANEFTVIYPAESPGGWNLIGTRVSAPLWDIAADPPNRVRVGDRVRFRAVR